METSASPVPESIPDDVEDEDELVVNTDELVQTTARPSQVDIRITIALAVPAAPSVASDASPTKSSPAKNKASPETTKIQGYYRVEYALLPGMPSVAYDIVVFRAAAKIYPDGQKAYVTSTWEDENNNCWIVWNQTHKLELEHDRLLALLSHKIVVKIWDSRDFCTVRTKLDKPRIGRLATGAGDDDDESSPKNQVRITVQNYADKWVAKPLLYKLQRKLPIRIPSPTPFLQQKIDDMEDSRPPSPVSPEALLETSIESIIGENKLEATGTTTNSSPSPHQSILKKSSEKSEPKPTPKKGSRNSKLNDEKKANGIAQIVIPSNLIFAGSKTITYRLGDDPLLPRTIQDCFVSVHVEDPQLLNASLAEQFNPLSITICHAENMPSTPLTYPELRQRCEPVYCSYKLFDQPAHRTPGKRQARHIYWHDVHIYLTNMLDQHVMSHFRNSPTLTIELHDRDECEQVRRRVSSVFGSETSDENIGRVSGQMKAPKSKNDLNWHPYGCVKLDLTELWLGQTALEFYTSVVPCPASHNPLGRSTGANHSSSHENLNIQQGNYLSGGTQMKIIVRVAKPLVPPVEHRLLDDRQLPTTLIAPFTRIVFLFSYDNITFLTALQTQIRILNARALEFGHQPPHVQVTTLSTYKLTEAQQENPELNIVTGFHLFDDEQHLFVLEGRKEEAIDLLYEAVPKTKGQNVEILYDSSVHFDERLYVKFGIDLTHIRLGRTLREIVSQPFIFVRDTLSKDTSDALGKLHQLVLAHKLNSSARRCLFPSMPMIASLNKDFGVPLTEKEIKLFSRDDRLPTPLRTPTLTPIQPARADEETSGVEHHYHSQIESAEGQTIPSSEENQRPEINFVARNMDRIRLASLKNKENRPVDDTLKFSTTGVVYPYSTQRLNSTENAREQMRAYLKQHHRSVSCSFNPEYPSLAYSPYANDETVFDFNYGLRKPFDFDVTRAHEKLTDQSLPNWSSARGYRSSRHCNVHPKLPDPARLDELTKPAHEWYEPRAIDPHPPIIPRHPCKWNSRNDDFDRWTRASSLARSVSVHWQSPDELSRAASTSPSATLIVADPRMHFLRRSAHTEMIDEGRLSATQLDRLTGILKDKPIKKGLLLPRSYSRHVVVVVGRHSACSRPTDRCPSSPRRLIY